MKAEILKFMWKSSFFYTAQISGNTIIFIRSSNFGKHSKRANNPVSREKSQIGSDQMLPEATSD
jgi:hypothetical protein